MSYQVIARQYRPQVFDEVVGQRLITDTLKNAILQNRVAHGYIFSGARGVGKTTTARILAKALNCVKGPTVTPCGECDSCREIAAGNSVDVLEIDAASNRGIDEIRELREAVRYLPSRDRTKVFIIDEVHMLTTEAFNALLKTLEEPPPRAVFILATTEPHKLPATIQSRCQHFSFRLLDYAEIVSRLEQVCGAENIQAEEGALSVLAQAAEGSLRDALSLLDQVIAACGQQVEESRVRQLLGVVPGDVLREIVESVSRGDAKRLLERVESLAQEGYDQAHFARDLTRYVRNLMVAKSCGAESPLLQIPNDERRILGELAGLLSEEDLTRFFQIVLRLEGEMRYSLEPRFHLEMGLLKLVEAGKLGSLEGLLAELRGATGTGTPPGASEGTKAPVAPRRDPGRAQQAAPAPELTGAREGITPRAAAVPEPNALAPPPREDERLTAIKSLAFQKKKFLGSCLAPAIGWRFADGEVRFMFAKKDAGVADLLTAREQQEMLRSVCTEVLGQPVRICVTLQDQEDDATRRARLSARDRAGRDAGVEALRTKFDCTLLDASDLSQE